MQLSFGVLVQNHVPHTRPLEREPWKAVVAAIVALLSEAARIFKPKIHAQHRAEYPDSRTQAHTPG
jgi:hypothetical protein